MKLPIGTYSFYNHFDNCPHKAYHLYVLRDIPYVETPEMAWGNRVHKALEDRVRFGAELPDEMRAAEMVARIFHDMSKVVPVIVEYQLAMTQKGEPCDYQDKAAFFRGKLDTVTMNKARSDAWLVDWKTGNVREDPFELECQALLLKVNQPTLSNIQGEYFWLKTGQSGLRYVLHDYDGTYRKIARLRTDAETYLRAAEWPKRKNPLCGWCPVTSCEHNTSHKRK